jgi:putative ABC transport system permease protein
MLSILGWSFERSLVLRLSRFFTAQLVVTSAFATGGYQDAPLSESVVNQLAQLPGVAVSVGEQGRDLEYLGKPVAIFAFDAPCFLDGRICNFRIDDGAPARAIPSVVYGKEVAVSGAFARLHGIHPGDTIQLPTPRGSRVFTVAAVTEGQIQSAIFINRALYREIWNDDLVSWIWIAVAEGNDPQQVSTVIASTLGPKYRLRVLDNTAMIDHFASQVRQAFSLQYVMELVTLILVLLGIGDTLAASVVAQTREIGIMRAVGLHRSNVFHIVILEGAAVALLGLTLAGLLGTALAVFWVEVQFPALLGWGLDLHVPLVPIVATIVITVALCLAGALGPSLRAAYLSVPAALRSE